MGRNPIKVYSFFSSSLSRSKSLATGQLARLAQAAGLKGKKRLQEGRFPWAAGGTRHRTIRPTGMLPAVPSVRPAWEARQGRQRGQPAFWKEGDVTLAGD